MSAKIIDGKAFAERLRVDIAERVAVLKGEKNITPGLAVIRVGNDPASEVYVRNKVKQTKETGMNSFEFVLPEATTQETLLAKIAELNADKSVHGILVQLPLPKHIREQAVIDTIDYRKDVDGFSPMNVGLFHTGENAFVPCTPVGCMKLLHDVVGDLSGKHAVVIGRSNIVGKPMARLLEQANCTVTVAHSKTKDLATVVKLGDIVVAAIGRPQMVRGDWLKPGCVVIDVGINRIEVGDGSTRLVGDCDFVSCAKVASAITPVPGGVGPMTIACLLENTLKAASV